MSETASLDEPLVSDNQKDTISDVATPKGSVQEDALESSSDEEEEDWDKELEIEEQEQRGNFLRSSLSHMFSASRASEPHGARVEEGFLPERWVLTKSLAEKTSKPVIVAFRLTVPALTFSLFSFARLLVWVRSSRTMHGPKGQCGRCS